MSRKAKVKQEPKFAKKQIIQSVEFAVYRDLLTALLDPTQTYSKEEVRKLINNFLNAEVE